MSQMKKGEGSKDWNYTTNVRSILKDTFPTATTLADYAALSSLELGTYPRHPYTTASANPFKNDEPEAEVDKDTQALIDGEVSDDTVGTTPKIRPPKKIPPSIVILPTRVVGRVRSTKATWKGSKSDIIPDRVQRTVLPSQSSRPLTRSQVTYPAKVFPEKSIVVVQVPDGRVGFEPSSYSAAQKHETWPLWEAAMLKEKKGLEMRGTFTRVTKADVPAGIRIMGSQYVYKDKRVTGAKARIVVRGDQQWPKPDTADTFAATPMSTEVRTLISLALQNNHALHSIDISQAFVQSDALADDAHLYIYPPQGSHEPPGTVWKLNRPLYGLAVAPRDWSDTLKAFLKDYGFSSVNNSDTFFKRSDTSSKENIFLVYHVDDILISFSNDKIGEDFKRAILSRFSGTDEGQVRRYLGIDITRDSKSIHLSQAVYAKEILERFGMLDCNPCAAPLDAGFTINKSDCPATPDPVRRLKFQEITGALQYLVQWTRPDLAFPTNELAKVNSNPSEDHLKVAHRVLRYLKGSADLGLTYTRNTAHPNRLIAYADADFAACTDTRRSISSYITTLNGAAVSWKSRQQKAVATSTSQAEYVSASWAADEILWLRRTLLDANAPQTQPTPLWEDNRACRMMSENPVHRERSKHIDYRVHALRERVADGVVRLLDCPTADMVADMGTKALPATAHCKHRDTAAMGLIAPTTPAIPADLSKRGGGSSS